MNKMLELTDAVSMFENKMQTDTKEIIRNGRIANSGILLEYLDSTFDKILVTCTVDGSPTHILLTAEKRLPFGDSREAIRANGLDFLFVNTDDKDESKWQFSVDLNDEDNSTKYEIKNEFLDTYKETPIRDMFSPILLEMRLILFFPVEGKTKNVDGIAAIEIGNELRENGGIVSFYNFRTVLETDVKYL